MIIDLDKYRLSTPVQIRFNDIDMLGHVNNAIQLSYLDQARLHYFHTVFGETVSWNGNTLVLVHIATDFKKPILLDDEILVLTRATKYGIKSISFEQLIISSDLKTVKTTSKSVMSGINTLNGKSIEIIAEWKKRVEEFEKVLDCLL